MPQHDDTKIRQQPPERFFGYYPGPVAVVTSAHDDVRNVMSAGWHAALSIDPAMYGVAINYHHATHALIEASQSFCINFLPFEHAKLIAAAGSVSLHEGVDKFERFGIETEAPLVGPAPVLKAAYLSYECSLSGTLRTGDHDWFAGDVVAVHYRADAYDERFLLEPKHTQAAMYFGRSRYMALGPDHPLTDVSDLRRG